MSNEIPSLAGLSASDEEIAIHSKHRAAALQRLATVEDAITTLKAKVTAEQFDIGQAAAQIAQGKFDVSQKDVSGIRRDLEWQESLAAALRLGIEKTDEAIAARNRTLSELVRQQALSVQCALLDKQFNALLDIAEAANLSERVQSSVGGEIGGALPKAYFPFWNMQGGGVGSFHRKADYLSALASFWDQVCGFQMTASQRSRLAAL